MKNLVFIIILLILSINNINGQKVEKWNIKERPKKGYWEVVKKIKGAEDIGWVITNEPLEQPSSYVDEWPLLNKYKCKPEKILIKQNIYSDQNVCYVWDGYKFVILYVEYKKSNDNMVRWNPQYTDCFKIPQI